MQINISDVKNGKWCMLVFVKKGQYLTALISAEILQSDWFNGGYFQYPPAQDRNLENLIKWQYFYKM